MRKINRPDCSSKWNIYIVCTLATMLHATVLNDFMVDLPGLTFVFRRKTRGKKKK